MTQTSGKWTSGERGVEMDCLSTRSKGRVKSQSEGVSTKRHGEPDLIQKHIPDNFTGDKKEVS